MMAENRTMSDHLRWLADTSESDGFSALYDIADRMEDLQEMLKAEKQLHAKTARTMHNAEADKTELLEFAQTVQKWLKTSRALISQSEKPAFKLLCAETIDIVAKHKP